MVSGFISFQGEFGDYYTLVRNFEFVGSVSYQDSPYKFNELESLLVSIPVILILFPVSLTLFHYRDKIKRLGRF